MDKDAWRRRAVDERIDLDPRSAAHCEHLGEFLDREVEDHRRVLVYDALAGEVDLSALVSASADPSRRYAITRTPEERPVLTLHPFGSPTERHRYGYRQPIASAPVVDDTDIGAVLVPALVFDRSGVRLGRGMGYYDRLLARLGDNVLRIGITGGYVVETLPADPHDVAMSHLATPTGVWKVPAPTEVISG